MGRRISLNDRAWDAISRLAAREHGWKARVARAAGMPLSSMSRIVARRQPVTLALLDTIEELEGINALSLLVSPADDLRPLRPDEMRVLRGFQALPRPVQQHLIALLMYVADEPPAETRVRQSIEYLRRLSERDQTVAAAYLLRLSEGGLPPDLEVAFGLPPKADERPRSKPSRKA